ncbi:MAG: 50S ribosomal protein L16 [Candidatus Micrarchaeia archaeon]
MVRLRPARTIRDNHSQAWARYSLRKPKKNYIKSMPQNHIQVFKTGIDKKDYDLVLTLNSDRYMQVRSNAIEAARQAANKYLSSKIPSDYFFRVLVYPHIALREHKLGSFAGADRTSRGMLLSFGRPVGLAARLKEGQPLFMVKTKKANKDIAKEALERASSKLSGIFKVKETEIAAQ